MKSVIKRKEVCFFALFFLLIISIYLSLFIGRYNGIMFSDEWKTVVANIRLPRILLSCMVGGALSVSGTVYQSVFHNPMASPDMLGASSSAALGAALGILLRFSSFGICMISFAFGLLGVLVVYLAGKALRGDDFISLILSGMVISSLFGSGTSFIKLCADPSDQLPAITYWLMGSFNNTDYRDVIIMLIPFVIGTLVLFVIGGKLNLLLLSDEEAMSMGVNVKIYRLIFIICATLLTASSVCVGGIIGWVGLIVPNILRGLFGNNSRFLIIMSVFAGGLFLLIIDDLSRSLFTGEIPLGILTSIIGTPLFFMILRKGMHLYE